MSAVTELVPADIRVAMTSVQEVATQYGLVAIHDHNPGEKTLMLAEGLRRVRELLTPQVMAPIMALQCSTLGFLTDKDISGGYTVDVVKGVATEAFLRGFRMVGNEVNIIAGRFYAARNGCKRLVLEWPGLTEFDMQLSYPQQRDGKTVVDMIAAWKLDGKIGRAHV